MRQVTLLLVFAFAYGAEVGHDYPYPWLVGLCSVVASVLAIWFLVNFVRSVLRRRRERTLR